MTLPFDDILRDYPVIAASLWLALLVGAALLVNGVARYALVKLLHHLLSGVNALYGQDVIESKLLPRLAQAAPVVIISEGVFAVPGLPAGMATVIYNVASAVLIMVFARAIAAGIDLFYLIWQRNGRNSTRSIKGYVQVVSIGVYVLAFILMIAAVMDRSPAILLSGLGALTAVLILVFQDTLLGLVASVQIHSSNLVRVGDWIEMPTQNADGFVTEIALYTVKVKNWDNTVTTVPIRAVVSQSVKNWRAMQESGGRRIKRTLPIDQESIRNLTAEELDRLRHVRGLQDYIARKTSEISEWNAAIGPAASRVDLRGLTNVGAFRAYVESYLRGHPEVHKDFLLLVRYMQPGPEGLPLEVYCFTTTVVFGEYEAIQSEIFDHLYAVLPEFGLKLFQLPTGGDLRVLGLRNAAA